MPSLGDFTTADQRLTGAADLGAMGVTAHPLTFTQALRAWEACKMQLEESRADFLASKNFGNSASVFIAAVVLSEAFCLAEDARETYEEVCDRDYHAALMAEKDARDAEELMSAIRQEAESA